MSEAFDLDRGPPRYRRPPAAGMGRKKGTKNKSTLLREAQIKMREGRTKEPLDVILDAMEFALSQADDYFGDFLLMLRRAAPPDMDEERFVEYLHEGFRLFAGMRSWRDVAYKAAVDAAPYRHPRLSAVAVKPIPPDGARTVVDVYFVDPDGTHRSLEELRRAQLPPPSGDEGKEE